MVETLAQQGAGDADDYFKLGALEAQHYANTGGNGYVIQEVSAGPEMYGHFFPGGKERRGRIGLPLGHITLRREIPPLN